MEAFLNQAKIKSFLLIQNASTITLTKTSKQ